MAFGFTNTNINFLQSSGRFGSLRVLKRRTKGKAGSSANGL